MDCVCACVCVWGGVDRRLTNVSVFLDRLLVVLLDQVQRLLHGAVVVELADATGGKHLVDLCWVCSSQRGGDVVM